MSLRRRHCEQGRLEGRCRVTSVYAQRASYRRQGINFVGGKLPTSSERRVSGAIDHKLVRDHLFVDDRESDFVGTWRGSRVQLYAVSRRSIEAIVNPKIAGIYIDRDTAARYSFGQLSPAALTFASAQSPGFRVRKRNLIVATSTKYAGPVILRAMERQFFETGAGAIVDLRPSVTVCVRDALADAVWGEAALEPVRYIDDTGVHRTLPFAKAMYDNFLRLRRFASVYAMRVEPRLQRFAFTHEQRWMQANTRALHRHMAIAMNSLPDSTIAAQITRLHGISGFSAEAIRDDIVTSFLAGVDTTRTAILATLRHVLDPVNADWKRQVHEVAPESVGDSAVMRACVMESMRIDTPGSVFNGRVTEDFRIWFGDKHIQLHRNTLVMPNIHALHAVHGSTFDPGRLLTSHTADGIAPLVIPFGKGPRSCPGKSFASSMIAVYVNAFVRRYPNAHLDAGHLDNRYPVHTSSEHGLHAELNND